MPRLILFDYGGVLLTLNDPVATFGIGESRADFNLRWLLSPAVQAHERGEIGPEAFARRMVVDMQLDYSWQDFIERFNAWPGGVPAATAALVQSIPADIDCAILSNTNGLHWAAQDIAGDFNGRIDRCFLSFETGHVKPDLRAFEHVLDSVPFKATDILFIDDNQKNIDAAARTGMRVRHCPDVDYLEAVLQSEGVIS